MKNSFSRFSRRKVSEGQDVLKRYSDTSTTCNSAGYTEGNRTLKFEHRWKRSVATPMTHSNVEPDKSHTRSTSERHRRSTELRVKGSHVDAWGISLHDTAAAAAATASKRPAERGRHDYRYIITHFSVSWRIPPCLLLSFTTCLDIFLSLALCPRLSSSSSSSSCVFYFVNKFRGWKSAEKREEKARRVGSQCQTCCSYRVSLTRKARSLPA